MLNVKCKEHLAKTLAYAQEVGLKEQLLKQLEYLANYGGGEENPNYCRCDLFEDFAPYSFTFCMYRTKEGEEPKFWFNGGLLYSSPSQPADGSFPLLSVDLEPGRHGWNIHT